MKDSVATEPLPSSEMLEAEYFRMAEVEAAMWWYTSLHASLLDSIQAVFGEAKGIRILDAGCGTGGFLRFLREHGYLNTLGVDISDIAVEFSKRQGFEVIQGSIADAAILERAGRVDVIVSMDVICSLPDEAQRAAFLRAAARQLAEPGLMLVQTPAFACLGGIHDLAVGVRHRYTRGGMRRLLEQAGIGGGSLRYRLTLLAPAIFLVRALQRLRLKYGKAAPIRSDVKMPSAGVNALLYHLQRMEDRRLGFRPFGTSLQLSFVKGQAKR